MAVVVLLHVACLSPRVKSDDAPPLRASNITAPLSSVGVAEPTPAASSIVPPSPSPPPMPSPPDRERVLIRHAPAANGYEIELQSPHGWSVKGLPVWLRIGTAQLRVSRESPSAGEYGIVFSVSPQEFASLPDGAEIVLMTSNRGQGRSLGRLDKTALVVQ